MAGTKVGDDDKECFKENDLKNFGNDFFLLKKKKFHEPIFRNYPFAPDGTGGILYYLWHSGQSTIHYVDRVRFLIFSSRQLGHLISSEMSIIHEVLIVNGWIYVIIKSFVKFNQ